ncbi:ribonuclease H2, subunit B [Mycena floridula]|nr:ribonuclease H2, subunit B [Mycena floridula]
MSVQIGILPADFLQSLSQNINGRFLRLPHPRTGLPALFVPHGSDQILEVQAVDPVNPRSWFIGQNVVADGKLVVFTRIDPAFLLIPILQALAPANGSPGNFRQADEMLEDAAKKIVQQSETDPSTQLTLHDITKFTLLDCSVKALGRICDVKEITDDIVVYRFSQSKAVEYLRRKVERLATPELFESSRTLVRNLAKDGLMEDGKEDLLKVARTRASCDLLSQYLSSTLYQALLASYDFSELDKYMSDLNAAQAPLGESSSKKKKKTDAAAPDTKKRKGAKPSQGVEKLKKANVNGMSKLSSFFKKS